MHVNELQMIPLQSIVLSNFGAQVERRKHYDKAAIAELAESINSVGLLQPIVVRPMKDKFEVVAGERRYLAATQAGLRHISASVRDLNDQKVLEVQLVENLQREGLHELAEAEGYEQLMTMGLTAEQVSDKVGRSKSYVYARLKLTALSKDARKAFYDGDLTASTALLLARIPGDDQQLRALKRITEKDWAGRVMSYRDASRYVHETFMLKLSEAPFPREDATLVPSAGPCGACPMRTGNQPELFGDVKGADVCTNPGCFQSKKAAHIKRELEKAKASGEAVIRGSDAKRILPAANGYSYSSDGAHKQLRNGYARPADKCLDDPKKRTYAELAGKDAPKVLLQNPDTGRVEKIFKIADITDRLKEKGIKPKPPAKDSAEAREQDQERAKQQEEAEMLARRAVFNAVLDAAPTKLSHEDLAALVVRSGGASDEDAFDLFGWECPQNYGARQAAFLKKLIALTPARLTQMAVAMTVIDDVLDSYGEPTELEALAKRLGVNAKKIRADLVAADKAKDTAKKAKQAKAKTAAKKK